MIYIPTTEDKKKYDAMTVVIVTPCGSYSNPFLFTKSLANLIAYSWMHGLKVDAFGGTQRMVVHWARNELGKNALELTNSRTGKPYTHILWLDDDHVFNPDMLLYLARNSDKDVISALYYGRTTPQPVAYIKDKNPDKYKHYPLIWPPKTLCEVDAVGFGACLMKREVLERMEYPWFKFLDCGEDIYFCVHAKEQGVRIWLEPTYELGHIGDPTIVGHAEYEAYLETNKETLGPKIKVALGGKDG